MELGRPVVTRTVDGVRWARQADVLAQLGEDVTDDMLYQWHRRYGLRKIRVGREVWWDLDGAIEVEFLTRHARRIRGGRPRGRRTPR